MYVMAPLQISDPLGCKTGVKFRIEIVVKSLACVPE